MAHHVDATQGQSAARARRKLLDQQRMRYRRAIELYGENRRLQCEISSYSELSGSESRSLH